jgi:hypothetical protein
MKNRSDLPAQYAPAPYGIPLAALVLGFICAALALALRSLVAAARLASDPIGLVQLSRGQPAAIRTLSAHRVGGEILIAPRLMEGLAPAAGAQLPQDNDSAGATWRSSGSGGPLSWDPTEAAEGDDLVRTSKPAASAGDRGAGIEVAAVASDGIPKESDDRPVMKREDREPGVVSMS